MVPPRRGQFVIGLDADDHYDDEEEDDDESDDDDDEDDDDDDDEDDYDDDQDDDQIMNSRKKGIHFKWAMVMVTGMFLEIKKTI